MMPSAKYSCSGSPLMLANGSTAIEGRSGRGGKCDTASAEAAWSAEVTAAIACDLRSSRASALVRASGSALRSSLEVLGKVFVVLERVRPAPGSSQCPHHHSVGILAQAVDRDRLVAGRESQVVHPSLELEELAQPDHGIESETFQPQLLAWQPIGPRFLRHPYVGEEATFVEIGRSREQLPAAVPDQRLEPDRIAIDGADFQRHLFAVADHHVLSQSPAQPEQGLAQVLPRLGLEMRAPEESCKLLARLWEGRRQGKVGEHAGEFFARQIDGFAWPGQLKAAKQ